MRAIYKPNRHFTFLSEAYRNATLRVFIVYTSLRHLSTSFFEKKWRKFFWGPCFFAVDMVLGLGDRRLILEALIEKFWKLFFYGWGHYPIVSSVNRITKEQPPTSSSCVLRTPTIFIDILLIYCLVPLPSWGPVSLAQQCSMFIFAYAGNVSGLLAAIEAASK